MKLTKFKYFKLSKKDNQELKKRHGKKYNITFGACWFEVGTGRFCLNVLNYYFMLDFRHNKKLGKTKTYFRF